MQSPASIWLKPAPIRCDLARDPALNGSNRLRAPGISPAKAAKFNQAALDPARHERARMAGVNRNSGHETVEVCAG